MATRKTYERSARASHWSGTAAEWMKFLDTALEIVSANGSSVEPYISLETRHSDEKFDDVEELRTDLENRDTSRITRIYASIHPAEGIREPEITLNFSKTMNSVTVKSGREEISTGAVARFEQLFKATTTWARLSRFIPPSCMVIGALLWLTSYALDGRIQRPFPGVVAVVGISIAAFGWINLFSTTGRIFPNFAIRDDKYNSPSARRPRRARATAKWLSLAILTAFIGVGIDRLIDAL